MSQKKLFDIEKEWEKEWKGMPEFKQEKREPIQQIIVSFTSFEDVKAFGELIDSFVSKDTKSLWFPKKDNIQPKKFRYVEKE